MNENLSKHLPKALRIKENIKDEFLRGRFGKPGEVFLSVREISESVNVTLVTAHRIMIMLRDENLIKLHGNRYVILPYKNKRKTEKTLNNHTNKKLIGLVVTNLENPFFSSLAKKVELVAKDAGFKVIIASSNYNLEKEEEILKLFCDSGVAGILSCPGTNPDTYRIYESLKIPFVFLGRKVDKIDADAVLAHNFLAAQHVAEHFISVGFRSFGYIGIKALNLDLRQNGFKHGLSERGYHLREDSILKTDSKDFDKTIPDICQFLKRIEKPVAIFCFHDLLALKVIKACGETGLAIPKDVAVAGFDNLPIASEIIPSLTTVSYPIRDMAQIALNRLLEKINSPMASRPTTIFLESELIIRESTTSINTASINQTMPEYLTYQMLA